MRTQEEILARIEEVEKTDFFGYQRNTLVGALTFASAKPFLKEEVTEAEWTPPYDTDENIRNALKDYLPFAWEKANTCRGLSAGRSMEYMATWLWLLGDHDDLVDFCEGYDRYGKSQLAEISERFGVDWRALDNGKWCNSEMEPALTPEQARTPMKKKEGSS